jgi:hypothetical protein
MHYILWLLVVLGAGAVLAARVLAEWIGWPPAVLVVAAAAALVLGLYARVWQWARSRERLIIRRPVAEVFGAVTEAFCRRGQPPATGAGQYAEAPPSVGLGAARRATAEYRQRAVEWTFTVTVFEQDRRFAFHGTTLPAVAQTRTDYTFAPVAGGTQVVVIYEYRFVGPRRILNPFVAFRIYDRNRAAILNLKQMLEAAPTGSTGAQ